ncbi:ISPg3, transposase [Rickettsia endosymbiont of Ixodes scapularis]|nr:ISPg3, transposase [Rickettsia endosymbiont of Ixodes scapularis]EER21483.1 ISPg3, transposase [Rickettsia endosymbiont of Ixodes scapularis]EER22451.1 ISPg3, transposase [Rickettsia endosymbiont of Ixodes scapularis]EER22463.1 ISPg3, transposase [Rickettsia endosymbiont of Ixodes scapularis]
MKKDITALFYFVDDFCKVAEYWISRSFLPISNKKPTRESKISHSELLTIVLLYHQSPCKNFKYFYMSYLQLYKSEFVTLPSYTRFIALKPRILTYLVLLLEWYMYQSQPTGVSYIDATSLAICHPKRVSRNKVFAGIAALGKTTKGWFFGFKLHLLINELGEIQGLKLTPGNIDDRVPVPEITKRITGLLFGDKCYIKQELFDELYVREIKLVTGIKKNMKNKLIPLIEKILLRKRSIIETVFSVLKGFLNLNIQDIDQFGMPSSISYLLLLLTV